MVSAFCGRTSIDQYYIYDGGGVGLSKFNMKVHAKSHLETFQKEPYSVGTEKSFLK
jgi:hypothetical protein